MEHKKTQVPPPGRKMSKAEARHYVNKELSELFHMFGRRVEQSKLSIPKR